MKKIFIILILISSLFISCNKEDEKELKIDGTINGKIIKTTTAEFKLGLGIYNFDGTPKVRALYKPVNSNEEYQKADVTLGFDKNLILLNLLKATRYELIFETYNDKSSAKTESFYFTTKAVNFNYDKFYSNFQNYSNAIEILSHTNKRHAILSDDFRDYNDIKVYLVNESKTDSIILPSQVIADSLKFSIPNNYVNKNPRESFKNAIVGVKIKDSYQYFFNSTTYYYDQNISFNNSLPIPAMYKIYNPDPVLNSVEFINEVNNTCPNTTLIKLSGEFLGFFSLYYWRPSQANLVIFKQDGTLFDTFIYNYGNNNSTTCNYFNLNFTGSTSPNYLNTQYHQSATAFCKTYLPVGSYKMKLVFNYANGTIVETNLVPITKS